MKKCKYCHKEFEPKNPKGKFCSDKCRVYWNRKNGKFKATKLLDDKTETANTGKSETQKQITTLETELKSLGDGILAKQRRRFIEGKISELKRDLK